MYVHRTSPVVWLQRVVPLPRMTARGRIQKGTANVQTPPRLSPLLRQFDFAREQLLNRLDGLTDEEYLWEPVPGCWSIRPRAEIGTPRSIGGGEWALELDSSPPDPPPFTTLAWRLNHLASGIALRADYLDGTRAMTWDDYQVPDTAVGAIDTLASVSGAWRSMLDNATDADLDQVGRSSFPWGLDPELPLLDIVWWVNQELLHHGAEIALLRDLYRAQRIRGDAR